MNMTHVIIINPVSIYDKMLKFGFKTGIHIVHLRRIIQTAYAMRWPLLLCSELIG